MRPVRTIAITGHRPGGLPLGAARHIRAGVCEVADQHPGATWLAGGAIGADQIATDELLRRGERVEMVLPFAPTVQSARWTRDQRLVQRDHLARAAVVRVVRDHYHPAGYFERNGIMVRLADLLVAFWNGRGGSGTAVTVRQAEVIGVPVIWVPMI